MTAPPSEPRTKSPRLLSDEEEEKIRIEKMTRSLRGDPQPSKPAAPSPSDRPREYRARAVLSYHRFLGRWTAP